MMEEEESIRNVYGRPPAKRRPPSHGGGDFLSHGHKPGGGGGHGDELWIYSYADLITNLLLFFIMMFAISNIDRNKFNALSQALNHDPKAKQEKPRAQLDVSEESVKQRMEGKTGVEKNVQVVELMQMLLKSIDMKALEAQKQAKIDYKELRDRLVKLTRDAKPDTSKEPAFEVMLPTERTFDKNSDTLLADAKIFLTQLGKELQARDGLQLTIEGHTDSTEAGSSAGRFALSARRAANVMDWLRTNGVRTDRMNIAGYADSRPLVAESTALGSVLARNQALNRRVTVKVVRPPAPDVPDIPAAPAAGAPKAGGAAGASTAPGSTAPKGNSDGNPKSK